eukprot:c12202_g1_i2.p1 GENE.c12202_g1_i2~~c12202_g1_i2.p1  ORF type:complete len:709 (-),score=169.39 c12202_g1_i2:260-2386(-)
MEQTANDQERESLGIDKLPWVLQTSSLAVLFDSILPTLNKCRALVLTPPSTQSFSEQKAESKSWSDLNTVFEEPWRWTSLGCQGNSNWLTSDIEIGVCSRCSKSLLIDVLSQHSASCVGPPVTLRKNPITKRTRNDLDTTEDDASMLDDSDLFTEQLPRVTTKKYQRQRKHDTESVGSSADEAPAGSTTDSQQPQISRSRTPTPVLANNQASATSQQQPAGEPEAPSSSSAPATPAVAGKPAKDQKDKKATSNSETNVTAVTSSPFRRATGGPARTRGKPGSENVRPRSLASRRVSKWRQHDGGLQGVLANLPTDDKGVFAPPMPIEAILSIGGSGSHSKHDSVCETPPLSPGFAARESSIRNYVYECGYPLMISPENMHILRGDQAWTASAGNTNTTVPPAVVQDAKKPAATKKKQTKSTKSKTGQNAATTLVSQQAQSGDNSNSRQMMSNMEPSAPASNGRNMKAETGDQSPVIAGLGGAPHPFATGLDAQALHNQATGRFAPQTVYRQRPQVQVQSRLMYQPYHPNAPQQGFSHPAPSLADTPVVSPQASMGMGMGMNLSMNTLTPATMDPNTMPPQHMHPPPIQPPAQQVFVSQPQQRLAPRQQPMYSYVPPQQPLQQPQMRSPHFNALTGSVYNQRGHVPLQYPQLFTGKQQEPMNNLRTARPNTPTSAQFKNLQSSLASSPVPTQQSMLPPSLSMSPSGPGM